MNLIILHNKKLIPNRIVELKLIDKKGKALPLKDNLQE